MDNLKSKLGHVWFYATSLHTFPIYKNDDLVEEDMLDIKENQRCLLSHDNSGNMLMVNIRLLCADGQILEYKVSFVDSNGGPNFKDLSFSCC
jgi:hypothetical protein